MGKSKKRFYTVWAGHKTGVFDNWDDCVKQIYGAKIKIFKSFRTKEEAENAFLSPPEQYVKIQPKYDKNEKYITDSICVDCAFSHSSKMGEYRGVKTDTGELLFSVTDLYDSSNNIAEFLAIVHGLAYCKKNNLNIPIYSDSAVAIGWVKNKFAKTNLIETGKNKRSFELIERAENWLAENAYENKVLKWLTPIWGQVKADYNRK